jgi:hypothetical protein
MSEDAPPASSTPTATTPPTMDYSTTPRVPDWMPRGAEWFWWGLLIVSLLVGFGLTAFAPI